MAPRGAKAFASQNHNGACGKQGNAHIIFNLKGLMSARGSKPEVTVSVGYVRSTLEAQRANNTY